MPQNNTEKIILYISLILNVVLAGVFVFGVVENEDDLSLTRPESEDEKNAQAEPLLPPAQETKTPPASAPIKPSNEPESPAPVPTVPSKKPVISVLTLPPDIHLGQITKVVENEFALVSRRSMNVPLLNVPASFDASFSGVLRWDDTTGRWVKFLVVTDVNPNDKNNPIDLWFEAPGGPSRILYLRVKDQNGAGSGEGVVKTLTPKNVEMSGWSIVQCYYHADDTGDGAPISKSSSQCQNAIITVVSQ